MKNLKRDRMKRYKALKSIDPRAVLRKTTSFLLIAVFCLTFVFIILIGPRPYEGGLREGDIATKTIKAPSDFYVPAGINQKMTRQKKEDAAAGVRDVYEIDNEEVRQVLSEVSIYFDEISLLKKDDKLNEKRKASSLKTKTSISLKSSYISYLMALAEKELSSIERVTEGLLREIMAKPIVVPEKKKELDRRDKKITIIDRSANVEVIAGVDEVITEAEALEVAQGLINDRLDSRDARSASLEIISRVLSANLVFNEELTGKRKQEARDKALPVYRQNLIKKNSIIVAKSQLVTGQHTLYLQKAQEIQNKESNKTSKIYYYYSISTFVIMFFLLFLLYLKLYEPAVFLNTRYLVLIGLLSFLIILSAKIISLSILSVYLIPLASISILIAILLNGRLAIVMTLFLSIFVGIITGEQLSTFIYSLSGGFIGIYLVQNVRRRAQVLKAGFFVGLMSCLTIINIDFMHGLNGKAVLYESFWGLINGLVCAFIVMGILPVLEYLFKITTNISLLELSDLNHPLLKEMVIKAPGTYHHSLIVGNLAEGAADSIGANSLLARVGAYYHDIGKLSKPEYFSENQMGFDDKHAELAPKMSSLIITSHIKEGVELARKYKLSDTILDFIRQHHGTSLTFYFYQRALEREKKDGEVKEEDFRYNAPLPQTKEVALVLLADSVEAATRAIASPTHKKIKKTVQKIINNKFIDGQLDECDLTLKDLHKISASFSRLLAGIYHSRVEYPDPDNEAE
ncbi:MAG: HDIG domain-containing protein [Candidatus Omnitrophica bacterium]|nr:HDIG domain-containing protein [Candidatus Omnitrophota bacterium]